MSGLRLARSRDRIALRHRDSLLFEYVHRPAIDPAESPKPYFHPIRTLAGATLTSFRPPDHAWHKGLAMTSTWLSGENFFGPRTYVHGRGYVPLDNVGSIEHDRWDRVSCDTSTLCARERLAWLSHARETWIAEERIITVADVRPEEGWWALDLRSRLRNVRGAELVFGSPTTRGRPDAGYGGLFWRGPDTFVGGAIIAGDGAEGPDVMGRPAPWLAYVSSAATLVFVDHPANPRFPTKWFVRNEGYAGVSFGLTFDEEYVLPRDMTLDLRYRIVLCNGSWMRRQLERLVPDGASR